MSNEFQYVYENAVKVDNNGYIEAVNINLFLLLCVFIEFICIYVLTHKK